jgi:hypothetical protein
MTRLGKRLDSLEERKAFQEFLEEKAQFDGRSADELQFLVLHGYWPEYAGSELPPNREYVLYGIRTRIINEWADKRDLHGTNSETLPEIRE